MRLGSLAVGCFLALVFVPMAQAAERSVIQRPNIVFILADDLGYGDVRCFNAHGKIATPHLDRLAAAGSAFHRRPLELGRLHPHALRDSDRALQTGAGRSRREFSTAIQTA